MRPFKPGSFCDEFCNPYSARPHSWRCHERWYAAFRAWILGEIPKAQP